MATIASSPTKNHSLYYSTEFRTIDQTLPTILHMAQNIFLPLASKRLSAFWLSDKCSEARKATLQAHFFTKLNIEPNFIPSFIRNNLTPEKMRILTDPTSFSELYPTSNKILSLELQGCLGLHKAMKHTDHIKSQLPILLDGIHQREKAKDWISSYVLAHILGTSRLSESLHNYDLTTNTSVTRMCLPFSSWLILLQRPDITHHLLAVFKKNLSSFGLDFERKTHCIESIINICLRQKNNNIIKLDCLSILLQLSLEPEGRKALLEADARQFLIDTIKSISHDFLYHRVKSRAKYILANLTQDREVLQSIFDNEPSIIETMLKDLDGSKELFYHPDAFNYLMNLLNIIVSLPHTLKAQQMIVIDDALFSIEKIKSWLMEAPLTTNASSLKELILFEKDIVHLGKTLKKRYSLTLEEIVEDPDSPSQAKLCPARSRADGSITIEHKQMSVTPPFPETAEKPSKSGDACCHIS